MGIASLGAATCFSSTFLFQGILSLATIGFPRFRRGFDSFAIVLIDCSIGTSIYVRVLVARM